MINVGNNNTMKVRISIIICLVFFLFQNLCFAMTSTVPQSTLASTTNFNYGYPMPVSQTPGPQQVLDKVFFLSETDWERICEEDQFDYIIIGSSVCSLAFAEAAFECNPDSKILILERGPYFLPEHFQNLPLPYEHTIGGLSETFPWTLSEKTISQPKGNIQWLHGTVPFFGGRSIMWSAWCPRPLAEEMHEWPTSLIENAQQNFSVAEKLLNVVPADEIDSDLLTLSDEIDMNSNKFCSEFLQKQLEESIQKRIKIRPIYYKMQKALQQMLKANLNRIPSAVRTMPAPIACGAGILLGLDFAKFSTPVPLLTLANRQKVVSNSGKGQPLRIVCNCIVNRIIQQDGKATALETNRGVVSIGNAKLILAMGAIPPATLLLNSFDELNKIGGRFTAHFTSAIIARIPRSDYDFNNKIADLEQAAIYMSGKGKTYKQQYHVQLSVVSDRKPTENTDKRNRYAPDVVATASKEQVIGSEDYLVFVCATLGAMDHINDKNYLRLNEGSDPTNNVTLQVLANENDNETWDIMDQATFEMLELVLSPKGATNVEYWHPADDDVLNSNGCWKNQRPVKTAIRVPGLVHEGSTLWIGEQQTQAPVGLDYRPFGIENVYVTGCGLWPTNGSWNPTLTMAALAIDLAKKLNNVNKPNTNKF